MFGNIKNIVRIFNNSVVIKWLLFVPLFLVVLAISPFVNTLMGILVFEITPVLTFLWLGLLAVPIYLLLVFCTQLRRELILYRKVCIEKTKATKEKDLVFRMQDMLKALHKDPNHAGYQGIALWKNVELAMLMGVDFRDIREQFDSVQGAFNPKNRIARPQLYVLYILSKDDGNSYFVVQAPGKQEVFSCKVSKIYSTLSLGYLS